MDDTLSTLRDQISSNEIWLGAPIIDAVTGGKLTYPKDSAINNGGDSNSSTDSSSKDSNSSNKSNSGSDSGDIEYSEVRETEYLYKTREEQREANKNIQLLLVSLIVIVLLAVVIVISMLCYYKNKKDKEFRVKNPHQRDSHLPLPKTDLSLSQTVPADALNVSNVNDEGAS